MQIKLDHVNFVYQANSPLAAQAVCDLSLQIAAGEFVVLLGHGGSGKSTLVQLIAGLLPATSGTVMVNDKVADKQQIFYEVGLVFQYPEQQFFGETVAEEVGFAARNKGFNDDAVAQLVQDSLMAVGLEPEQFLERNPFLLSGGQKRRVALAGVLALDPQILIFDEPSAGLDECGRHWLWELVCKQQQSGKTIIWITHDMDEAALLAQRVLVMKRGVLAADMRPQALFYDRHLLSELGLRQPTAPRLLQELQSRGVPVPGQALTIAGAAAEITAALARRQR